MAKKKHKRRVDRCDFCKKRIDVDAPDTTYRLLLPKGTSREVMREAFERAEAAEEAAPLEGDARYIAQVPVLVLLGHDAPEDEDERVVHGRALTNLGAYIIQLHPDCAEEQSDAPSYYETPGWGD